MTSGSETDPYMEEGGNKHSDIIDMKISKGEVTSCSINTEKLAPMTTIRKNNISDDFLKIFSTHFNKDQMLQFSSLPAN